MVKTKIVPNAKTQKNPTQKLPEPQRFSKCPYTQQNSDLNDITISQ